MKDKPRNLGHDSFASYFGVEQSKPKTNQYINQKPQQYSQKIYNNNNVNEFNEIIDKIKKGGPLSNTLTIEEINLPHKIAWKVASNFQGREDDKSINTNQLRKYFDMALSTKDKDSFEEKRQTLYQMLPFIAYAAARKVCPVDFYKLIEACISPTAIVSEKDVEVFIDFLTAVVAYSSYIMKK